MIIPKINNVEESRQFRELSQQKLKISGFNNLTKILSFNLYDFCLTTSEKQKIEYAKYINNRYNAEKVVEISKKVCEIIEANILNVSAQDYDPVGASSMVLMSDIKGGKWEEEGINANPNIIQEVKTTNVSMHLDKSHITSHTYPDTMDPRGLCTFRVDIDVATCGDIIPLSAINYLFQVFECDVVIIDYVVRGYTRLQDGMKIFNDHTFNSIQDFIHPSILDCYKVKADINLPKDNIWQTKLLVSDDIKIEDYLFDPRDKANIDINSSMSYLKSEMKEIFHLIH